MVKSDGLCNDSDIEAAGMNRFEQLHNLFVYCPASNITTRIVLWRVENVCFLSKNGLSGSWKNHVLSRSQNTLRLQWLLEPEQQKQTTHTYLYCGFWSLSPKKTLRLLWSFLSLSQASLPRTPEKKGSTIPSPNYFC